MVRTSPERSSSRRAPVALAGLLALLVSGAGLDAQEVEGPLSPAGRLRIGASPSLSTAETRFGRRIEDGREIEEKEPLAFDLIADSVDADVLPSLSGLRSALADALGRPDPPPVTLGRSRGRARETRTRVPLRVDLGITDWLTVGVTVPLERNRSEVTFLLRADTTTANLGVSPGIDAPDAAVAFLDSLGTAVEAMASRTDAICSDAPGSTECEEARDALARGRSFHDGLDRGYAGAFFPIASSSLGRALRDELAALADRFAGHDVTSVPGDLPLAAGPLAEGRFQQLLTDPRSGVAGEPLETWQGGWELGDVELEGALRLLERRRTDTAGFFRGPSVVLGVGGLVRFGTGRARNPDRFFDLPPGDGQTDLEGRVFGDVGFARRLGVWADLRYGVQREGEVVRRIAPPDVVLAPLARRTPVRWTPGNYLDLEVAPRLHLTPEFAVAARYRLFTKDADRFAAAPGEPGPDGAAELPDPELLERETRVRLQEVGASLVFSTLDAARAGRTGFPFEARFRYRTAFAGSGGRTRDAGRWEVALRLFWRLWGDG